MNFYMSFLYFIIVIMCVFSKNIVIRSGVETPNHQSIGLKFYTAVNNTGEEDLIVEANPDNCCLDADDHKCNIINIMGSATELIAKGETRTLTLVAPLLNPYERKGYCTIHVDSRPTSNPKNIARQTVKIKFDTTLCKKHHPDNTIICKHPDEDPLNFCKPVNCDLFYNGKRPFYHQSKKRCIRVPNCSSRIDSEVPRVAYNPVSNKCVNKPSICKDDIDFVKSTQKNRSTKDIVIIQKAKDASHDLSNGKVSSEDKVEGSSIRNSNKSILNKGINEVLLKIGRITKQNNVHIFMRYLLSNRFTFLILILVILIQCFLICAMVYCLSENCLCRKKPIVDKFFCNRHDASVTTPLIGTSNMDTATTDFQYLSESSNGIDKKIKCYKACQKEAKNNIKLSMSDDILSKCLTRRDWNRMPKSETIPEVKMDEESKVLENNINHFDDKIVPDVKVNFQNEIPDKVPIPENLPVVENLETKNNNETMSDSSEKEIKCHSYIFNKSSNLSGFKKSNHNRSKIFGVFRHDKSPGSVEKGAQACFSNDSIDDFLSERGVLFFGDNLSKYSFTSASSAGKSSLSSPSSKTSKNNIVKNVLSLLSRKKKAPSSDPGVEKSNDDLDLELLRLSRKSSNGTEYAKDIKRIKDSTL